MSDHNYYQPHVWIDGVQLGESAPAEDIAAVADFVIKWGAADWFENVEPGTLTMTLTDPYGDFLTTGKGASIVITRDPDNATVFVGTIDEVRSQYGKVRDPRTGATRPMWKHTITAFDPLGALARDRRRGPLYADSRTTIKNTHWGNCYMVDRKNDLDTRSPVRISWPATIIDFTDAYKNSSQFMLFPPVVGYEYAETVSVLTVLRNTARAIGAFQRPYFDPATREIRFVGRAGVQSMLQNDTTQPVIYLSEREEFNFGHVDLLRGGDFIDASGLETSTGAREQVTRAEINIFMPQLQKDESGRVKVTKTTMPIEANAVPKSGAQLSVQMDCDICYEFLQDTIPGTSQTVEQRLRTSATAPISQAYGFAKIAPLVYRFPKTRAAPEWALPFLVPAPPRSPTDTWTQQYRLVESLTNMIPGTTTFGIVGGELKYTDRHGWTATLNPAHTIGDTLTPTLGDITSQITLNRVADSSFVADWQHLQIAN